MYFYVCLKIQILLLEVKYIWWCISLTSVNSTSGGVCSTSSSNFTLILSPFEPALHQYCNVRIFNDFFFLCRCNLNNHPVNRLWDPTQSLGHTVHDSSVKKFQCQRSLYPIIFCRSRNFCLLSTGISSKLIPWLLPLWWKHGWMNTIQVLQHIRYMTSTSMGGGGLTLRCLEGQGGVC